MAKHLNVNLTFNADTEQAKKKIQDLQTSLQNVAKLPGASTELFDDVSIQKASQAALELERHLSRAVNVDTGKLDLSRFSQSLKASGKDLTSYCNTLLSIGPAGQTAFLNLAQAIATADTPVTRVNSKLKELGTTLANTARWQISSSILHGFMGAVQSAYGYAQDLNESLNDIRIVTGKSTTEMARFAKQANEAAKALSTTTNEYAEASLIYFQQGDNMEAVEEKAAITVKMAQVTGQGMETVSDQMTAVWNNFYDGSQSLEHYADAMARLGAITASSSDEIAQGLEKFAAVADMIGLGFDEAAAALTTVTANTRQSADVVGTAFKTIFARIQGLNLGETLEDGTTLNKYSEALNKVGINIKDTSGQMKDMNTILNEMGEKWNTLSQDQQIALAQTVAGVRQYSQLVSLMENFDDYQANLTEAQGADGELATQSAIYAEGWEAARDRVQAALEGVYDSLINDEFFIDLLNGLEKVIKGVETFIDIFGGLGGVLQAVGGIFMTMYANKMPEVMNGLMQNIRTLTGQAKKDMAAMQAQLDTTLTTTQNDASLPESFRIQAEGIANVNRMKQELVKKSKELTVAEQEEYEARIRNIQAMYKDIDALVQKKEVAEKTMNKTSTKMASSAGSKVAGLFQNYNALNEQETVHTKRLEEVGGTEADTTQDNIDEINRQVEALEKVRQKATEVEGEITALAQAYGFTADEINELTLGNGAPTPELLNAMKEKVTEIAAAYSDLSTKQAVLDNVQGSISRQTEAWQQNWAEIQTTGVQIERLQGKGKSLTYISKQTDIMRNKMVAYMKAISKTVKNQGFTELADQAEAAAESMKDMSPEEMITSFKEFQEQVQPALDSVDSKILDVEATMQDMQFDPAAMQEMGDAAREAAEAQVDLANALANTNEQANQSPESSFKMSEALAAIGGAAMSTMAAVTAVKNGFATIFDSDTSFGEKIAAGIAMVTSVMGAYNAILAASTALKKSDTIAAAANALGMKVMALIAPATIAAKTGETAAVWANTAAWYANPIMWIAVIIMAVIAAFAALVAIISAVSDALKSMDPGERLKAAEEEAARMAEEFNKAKEAADALRNSIESYDSAVDKLKTLTEGTAEWKEALNDANDKALKLLEENSELEGKYSLNVETGLIEFDEGALEDLQASKDEIAQNARNNVLVANSNVSEAKNNVLLSDATKNSAGETAGAIAATTVAAIGLSLIPVIGPFLSTAAIGGSIGANVNQKEGQQEALNHLAEAFNDANGNLTVAMEDLSDNERELIDQLDMSQPELLALTQQLAANKEAIEENNKQLLHGQFKDKEEFKESSNKDFLLSSMQDDLKAATEKQTAIYDKKKDKEVEAEYAKMMGWGDDVETETEDGVIIYTDKDGNELGKVGEDSIRGYLAQEAALNSLNDSFAEQANKVDELSDREEHLAMLFDKGQITYDQYTAAVAEAGKEIGFTAEEMEEYTKNHGSDVIKRERKEQTLAKTLNANFDMGDNAAKEFVDEITQDMSDEQLEIALDIAATAESLDDFKRQFQHVATEALISSVQDSKSNVSTMLSAADEAGGFSSADLASLKTDENFTAWLEQNNKTMRDLTTASYTEQYNIISQFYSDLQQMELEHLEMQKQNYQDDLAEYQAIMDYKMAQEEDDAAAMQAIQDAWGDTIDFEAYMDLNTDELQAKLDEAANKIKEITDQKYAIDMSWDGIDQLEGAMDELSDVTTMMEKDARKVGDSYQITAAQGKEWIKMYPELFKNAEVTTDGLIELSEADYEAFKATQESEREAAIETEIQKLEARLSELDAEEKAAQAELDLIAAIEEGKVDYSNASAESIAKTRSNLTQFYIDSGYDEVAANQMALEQMGLTQEQYNDLIAQSTEANAKDMATGAQSGAEAMRKTYSSLAQKLKDVFANIGKAIKAIFTGDWDSIGDYFSQAWEAAKGEIKPETTTDAASDNITSSISSSIDKYSSTAVFEDTSADAFAAARENIQNNLDQINASRQNINSQITYLQALKNQGISNFGETSVNSIVPEKEIIEAMADAAERYHNLTKEAEALEHVLSMIDAQSSQAFGKDKVQLMEQQEKALKDLQSTQEQLLLAQKAYLASDFGEITNQFSGTGISAMTDEFGNLANYNDLVNAAQQAYNQAIEIYNTSSQDENAKEALDAAKDLYDTRIESLEQYEETLSDVQSAEETLLDTQTKLSAAALDTITYNLEYQLDIDDRNIEMLDYRLDRIAEDFYKKAESAALMVGSVNQSGSLSPGGKLGALINNQGLYSKARSDLAQKYAEGTLTDSDYAAGLEEVANQIMDNISALNELDQSMIHYYSDSLVAANEELSKYTDRMEHHNNVLEHYNTLLSLIGEEANFEAIGVILEGQAKLAENNLKVSTEAYNAYNAEAQKWSQKMQESIAGSAEFELFKANWESAEVQAREAQDKMLSDVATWAEAQKDILQNSLSSLGQTLEEALTGGLNFDQLTTQMERASSLQEEYLTTTNQIYETTKMMRTAQQAIDSNSNTVAKEKLKHFITETKSLQEQGKLSQYELDMQQAKYDLLVAEIALEEAQNAKSTVRLQRDSEGNFGYVYTADAGAISAAQQQFDDAQNTLYNKGLEGANDYTQKYQQTMSEMTDTLKTIQEDYLNGSFATEAEYHAAMENAKAFYFEKLQGYSSLYSVALSADSNIAAEAWSTDFAGMVKNTEEWKIQVDSYITDVTSAFSNWSQAMSTVKNTTGKDLTELANNVSSITDENDKLANEILNEENGVLTALQEELTAVGDLTTAYGNYRDSVLSAVSALERLAIASNNSINGLAAGGTTTINTTPTVPAGTASNDDGGYTGSWGPSGKLAFLHEKEMILTQEETKKFFDNLSIMENILATLDLYAVQQQMGGLLASPGYQQTQNGVLEQNVKIEANFPGVTDRNEIEEALNNLVNKASQYANRK